MSERLPGYLLDWLEHRCDATTGDRTPQVGVATPLLRSLLAEVRLARAGQQQRTSDTPGTYGRYPTSPVYEGGVPRRATYRTCPDCGVRTPHLYPALTDPQRQVCATCVVLGPPTPTMTEETTTDDR